MPVPATNQLVDGAGVRSAIAAGALIWASSDPGTGTLPNNRIMTWLDYKNYIATTGTSQFANNQCTDYQAFLTYAITNPTIISISPTWNYGTSSIDIFFSYAGPAGTSVTIRGSTNSGASFRIIQAGATVSPGSDSGFYTFAQVSNSPGVLIQCQAICTGFPNSAFVTQLTGF